MATSADRLDLSQNHIGKIGLEALANNHVIGEIYTQDNDGIAALTDQHHAKMLDVKSHMLDVCKYLAKSHKKSVSCNHIDVIHS